MKAEELMLFDIVRRKKDSKSMTVVELRYAETIAAITPDDVYYGDMEDYHESEIEPIPLTPEILEKNGFSGEGYNMGIVGFSVEPIPDEKDGYEVFIWKDMCLQIKHGFTHFKKYIKYVHELQHALRLCGIEKEIVVM